MDRRRYADSSSQVQELEEILSNLRFSPSTNPNPLYNSARIHEPIFNRSPPLTANPHWLQTAPRFTPPAPPMRFTTSQLNPLYLPTTAQQNTWVPPMGPPPTWSTAAEDQSRLWFDAPVNLQDSTRTMTRDNIEMLFQEVLERIHEMMTHPTANYVVQRLIEVAEEEQKRRLVVLLVQTRFLLPMVCCDTHGTKVMQKLVQNLKNRFQKDYLVLALQPDVLPLALNDNGRHVIIQCLRNFSDTENKPILTELARNVIIMGRDKSGYLVLTDCIGCYSSGPNVALVLNHVTQNALLLSHDEYGNYVVQQALEQNIPTLTSNIVSRLQGNYAGLSVCKYGSNVVEKCLKVSSRDQTGSIIDELLRSEEISRIVVHSYGNYVLQTCLTISKSKGLEIHHRKLLSLLRMHIAELKISRHGKRLVKWVSSSSR